MKKPAAGAAGGGAAVAVAETAATALEHGSVVIAAITSCTNTSNPSVMIGAGLLAKKAVERGLTRKPWVKTSLAPGSKVVTEYLRKAGLDAYLDRLGFNLVGYGCTTCIGNSGPLPDEVAAEVRDRNLVVASVLSGNRNFEGRIQSGRAGELPRVAAARRRVCAGRQHDRRSHERAAGHRHATARRSTCATSGRASGRFRRTMLASIDADVFRQQYASVFEGNERWRALPVPTGARFEWDEDSTYIRRPTFLEGLSMEPAPPARDRRRTRPGAARRQHHDRPHFSGRLDPRRQSGRQVPDRARGRAEGIQFVRRAPRQSRGDGAGHVRQRAAAQPDRAGHRGRVDDAISRPAS